MNVYDKKKGFGYKKMKYYAVKNGLNPGIYLDWETCKKQINGFSNAIYKKFNTLEEAKLFMESNKTESKTESFIEDNMPLNYAFIDGSFNQKTNTYGYGGFLMSKGNKHILKGNGNDKEMASMRNVAGEIMGAVASIEKALELGIDNLVIYYDYEGIKSWAEGIWKTNKSYTKEYSKFVESVRSKIDIKFIHVKAHTGIEGNEEADFLAKQSVGLV